MTAPQQSFLDGRVGLHQGDCREVLKTLADNSIDSVVCDPPYNLRFTRDFISTDSPLGRWPANLVLDGSDEVIAAFPFRQATGSNGRITHNNETASVAKGKNKP
jgi:DNA modification methylase